MPDNTPLKYATSLHRLGAYILEGLLFSILFKEYIYSVKNPELKALLTILFIIFALIWPLIKSYLVHKHGCGPSEFLMQMRLIDVHTNNKPVFGNALKREYLGYLYAVASTFALDTIAQVELPFSLFAWVLLALPYLWFFIDARRQTLFDKLANIIVVDIAPHLYFDKYPVELEEKEHSIFSEHYIVK